MDSEHEICSPSFPNVFYPMLTSQAQEPGSGVDVVRGMLDKFIPQKIPFVTLSLNGSNLRDQPTPRCQRSEPTLPPYLSLDKGLGSGRMAAMERDACLEGDEEKFRSKEPAFLCSGSMPTAPCISLSMGQDPALPWMDSEDTSGPTAPWSEVSTATWES